jgi:hypothetical protein
MLQLVRQQFHGFSEPDRVRRVILNFIIGERVDQNIEPLTVEHQPRHDIRGEGILRKDRLHLRDRMRPGDTNELGPAGLGLELLDEGVMQLCRPRPGCVVEVDVDVIAMKIFPAWTRPFPPPSLAAFPGCRAFCPA